MTPMQRQSIQASRMILQPRRPFMMVLYLMAWWMFTYRSIATRTEQTFENYHCYSSDKLPRDTTATAIMVVMSPWSALHVSDLSVWSPGSPPCMVTSTGVLRLVTRGSTVSARARLAINRMDRRRVVAWGGKTSHFMDTLFITLEEMLSFFKSLPECKEPMPKGTKQNWS